MQIRQLPEIFDQAACYRAQRRNFGHHVRRIRYPKFITNGEEKMATNNVAQLALAKAKKLREQKSSTAPKPTLVKSGKTTPAKKSAKAVKATRKLRHGDVPYAKIAQMYDSGKSAAEISDALEYTEKSNWPYQYTYGILKRLRVGVEVNGKTIKVKPKQK